jgi:hypothetical protein
VTEPLFRFGMKITDVDDVCYGIDCIATIALQKLLGVRSSNGEI